MTMRVRNRVSEILDCERGLTMLELLVALVILAVGIGFMEPGFFTSRHFLIQMMEGGK